MVAGPAGSGLAPRRVGQPDVAVHRRSAFGSHRGLVVPHPGLLLGGPLPPPALFRLPASPQRAGISWAEFDAAPPPRASRPVTRGGYCAVPDCEGELLCRGLCARHDRAWRKAKSEPIELFLARARPLPRAADCVVAGCTREQVTRRGLCHFHDHRLHRRHWCCAIGQPLRSVRKSNVHGIVTQLNFSETNWVHSF